MTNAVTRAEIQKDAEILNLEANEGRAERSLKAQFRGGRGGKFLGVFMCLPSESVVYSSSLDVSMLK